MERDTIAAISTHHIPSAIGILRLSGPRAAEIAQKCFKPLGPNGLKHFCAISAARGPDRRRIPMALGTGAVEMAAMVSRSNGKDLPVYSGNKFRRIWNQFLQNVSCFLFGEYLPLTGVMVTKNERELYLS